MVTAARLGDRELVVAGGEAPPLLDESERSFYDVASAVGNGVEPGWAAAA